MRQMSCLLPKRLQTTTSQHTRHQGGNTDAQKATCENMRRPRGNHRAMFSRTRCSHKVLAKGLTRPSAKPKHTEIWRRDRRSPTHVLDNGRQRLPVPTPYCCVSASGALGANAFPNHLPCATRPDELCPMIASRPVHAPACWSPERPGPMLRHCRRPCPATGADPLSPSFGLRTSIHHPKQEPPHIHVRIGGAGCARAHNLLLEPSARGKSAPPPAGSMRPPQQLRLRRYLAALFPQGDVFGVPLGPRRCRDSARTSPTPKTWMLGRSGRCLGNNRPKPQGLQGRNTRR